MDFEKETDEMLRYFPNSILPEVRGYIKARIEYLYSKGKMDAGEEIKKIIRPVKQP